MEKVRKITPAPLNHATTFGLSFFHTIKLIFKIQWVNYFPIFLQVNIDKGISIDIAITQRVHNIKQI